MSSSSQEQPEAAPGKSSLGLRVASALILAPVVLGLVWIGGWPFVLLLAVVGPLMAREWAMLAAPDGSATLDFVIISLGLWCVLGFSALGSADIGFACAIALVGLGVSISLFRGGSGLRLILGVCYIGFPVIAFAWLRADPAYGLIALFWLLALVWATDIFAYFAGKTIGGPKMAPTWSPNKTWAGLVGGVSGAILAGALVAAWLGTALWALALTSGALAVLSQGGDVVESAMKRRAGVKDSGALIPGHGGILDRVDGLMFAAVGAALIAFLRSGEVSGVLLWP
jgi:phosphatidate cytidylyltransferase